MLGPRWTKELLERCTPRELLVIVGEYGAEAVARRMGYQDVEEFIRKKQGTTAMMNPEQKQIHKANMLRIAVAAIEHALPSTKVDPGTKQLVEQRIKSVFDGSFDVHMKQIRLHDETRRGRLFEPYDPLLAASNLLIRLADYGGYAAGWQVRNIFTRCKDAVEDYNRQKAVEERKWQDEMLEPLIEQAFEHQGAPLAVSVPS